MARQTESLTEDEARLSDGSVSTDEEPSPGAPKATGRKRKSSGGYQKTSCELCKSRKVKCDRAEPACTWCAKHKKQCVYRERRTLSSRAEQINDLETKVNRLDALLQVLGRRVEEHLLNDHGPFMHLPPPAAPHHIGAAGPERLPPHVQGVASPTPAHAASASTYMQGPYPSPARTDNHIGLDAHGSDRTSVQSLLNSSTTSNALPTTVLEKVPVPSTQLPDLPPHDVLYTLVDLYFKHTNTWLPVLDRKTTFATLFGDTFLAEGDRIILFSIIASTLRFFQDSRLTAEMKAHFHQVARRKVELYATEHTSIETVKALIILLCDVFGTSNGPRGWNLLALLTQNAKQLGLLVESKVYLVTGSNTQQPQLGPTGTVILPRPDTFTEDEGRRRLAWTIYLLDRYESIATTSIGFVLDDKDIDRQLPSSYDLFSRNIPVETGPCFSWSPATIDNPVINGQTPCEAMADLMLRQRDNLGSFSYHCQILRILSGIHEFLRTPLDIASASAVDAWRTTYKSFDKGLNVWLQSLPGEYSRISSLCHSDPASRVVNWFMLHSVFVISVVRLHSAAAFPSIALLATRPPTSSTGEPLFAPSYYATQRCLTAIDSLRDIVRDVHEVDGLDLLGPPFAFALWMAGRLLLVHAASVGAAVDPKIDFFIETLGHIGRNWEIAGKYSNILARVVRRGREGFMTFTAMRRSAHELTSSMASIRQSGMEPTASRPTSVDELDFVEVFDFFNVPKISAAALQANSIYGLAQDDTRAIGQVGLGIADPESDWLR